MIVVNRSRHSVAWMVGKIRPPISTATFIVKGTFDLRPGEPAVASDTPLPLCGDEYVDDDPNRNLRYSTDFVPRKPKADALLAGSVYAPGGKPATVVPVSFQVGSWSKRLAAIGDRIARALSTSPPAPFLQMELSYENAYGGPDFKANPIGKGAAEEKSADGARVRRLPNFDAVSPHEMDTDRRTEPVGFGPIPTTWIQRMRKAGTYGKKWLKERWPWLPDDIDWSFFNSAPDDQQFSAYLRGDERIVFENLHPKHPRYESALPGVRTRCLFSEEGGFHPRLREVPMNLDTLWAQADRERLVLVWRGTTDLRDRQLPEKGILLLASEPLAESPRPLAHYEDLLDGIVTEATKAPRELSIVPGPPAPPVPPPPPEVVVPKPPPPPPPPEAVQLEAQIQSILKGIKPPVPPPLPPAPSDPMQVIAMAKKQAAAAGFKIPPEDPEPPPIPKPAEPALPVEPPPKDRAWCKTRKDLSGLDLTGVDLSDLDLAGVSFKDSVLTKADFRKARLSGADFENALLPGADLSQADLQRARFVNADLTGARLAEANLREAVLDGADFSEARLPKAVLARSRGVGVRFAGAKLSDADLHAVEWPAADLSRALLHGANLVEAKLAEASLESAAGSRMVAERADFTKVRAAGCNFGESKFRRLIAPFSIWQGAQLFRADFSESNLEQAQFGSAYLCQARLNLSNLKRARLDQANLRKAELLRINFLQGSFLQADLTGADVAESNLFQADFFEAATTGASFQGANLKRTSLTT